MITVLRARQQNHAAADELGITSAPSARINEYMMREEGNPHVRYTPEEIAADAVACREAGASIVHFHARQPDGAPEHVASGAAAEGLGVPLCRPARDHEAGT